MRCWPCAINSGLGSENELEKGRHLTDVLGFLQRPRGFTRRAMNLLKAVATVSSMTLISRILGFVRDLVIARVFGAGFVTDAFFVAFKLPNFLRRLFAEGAFSQAFVPVLAEYKNQRGHEETRLLVDHVSAVLALALFVVSVIGVLAAPALIYLTAPGFSATPE